MKKSNKFLVRIFTLMLLVIFTLLLGCKKESLTEQQQLNESCKAILVKWLNSEIKLEQYMEGITEEFAGFLNSKKGEVSFRDFFHQGEKSGWKWEMVGFTEIFQTPLFFYYPENWKLSSLQKDRCSIAGTDELTYQNIEVTTKQSFIATRNAIFESLNVIAFTGYPANENFDYANFLIVSVEDNNYNIYTFFANKENLAIATTTTNDPALMRTQLTSLMNTKPWYLWTKKGSL